MKRVACLWRLRKGCRGGLSYQQDSPEIIPLLFKLNEVPAPDWLDETCRDGGFGSEAFYAGEVILFPGNVPA